MVARLGLVLSLFSSLAAHAQQSPASPQMLYNMLATNPGTYITYNKAEIEKTVLDLIQQRSKTDYDYFIRAVNQVEATFQELMQNAIYSNSTEEPGLKALSDRSILSSEKADMIPALDLQKAINRYNLAKLTLELRIQNLTAIAKGALPSQIEVGTDSGTPKNIPNYGNIDFSLVEKFYAEKVEFMNTWASNFGYKILLPNGNPQFVAPNTGKGLFIELPGIMISGEAVYKLRKEIAEKLRVSDPDQYDQIVEYTSNIKKLVQTFLRVYGESERFRHQNAQVLLAAQDAYRQMVVAFWTRSYLRANYGLQMGVIGINYKKRWANLDYLFATGIEWREEPAMTQTEIMEVEQNYINALNTNADKTLKVLSGDASVMARVSSAMTWVSGNRRLAEVATQVLGLLLSDVYEEKVLAIEGDLPRLTAYYQTRYFGSTEDEQYYRGLRVAYDPASDEVADASTTALTSSGNIRGWFNDIKSVAIAKQVDIDLAHELELQLAAMVNSPSLKKIDRNKKKF